MSASARKNSAPSASDGTALCGYHWAPQCEIGQEGVPRGRVLLVHGLGEHLGRYQSVAEAFAHVGMEVGGVDLRGFGKSLGRRGHISQWQDYGRDLDQGLALLSPGPVLVFAHSMGGLVALDWLRTQRGESRVTALCCSGPLVGNAATPPAWQHHLAKVLSHLCPILPFPNGIPLEDLSSLEPEVEHFRQDPLRIGTVTPRWYREMLTALDHAWEFIPQATLPMQLHIAEEERVISLPALEKLSQCWGGAIETVSWPGSRHEIMHDLAQEEFLAKIAAYAQDIFRR